MLDNSLHPPSPAELAALANSANAFGLQLYHRIAPNHVKTTHSPASVGMALAMTWGGAREETASQMASGLRLTTSRDTTFRVYRSLLATVRQPARTAYTLAIANRLFGDKSFAFE